MHPHDDPAWAHYASAILRFAWGAAPGGVESRLEIDLARPLDDDDRAALRRAGLAGPFAVVTAANPRGRRLDAAANAARLAQLEKAICSEAGSGGRPARWIRCDGLSRDRAHREHGFAATIAIDEAIELGRRFEQTAIYWFDGERFSIVGALARTEPIALPAAGGR